MAPHFELVAGSGGRLERAEEGPATGHSAYGRFFRPLTRQLRAHGFQPMGGRQGGWTGRNRTFRTGYEDQWIYYVLQVDGYEDKSWVWLYIGCDDHQAVLAALSAYRAEIDAGLGRGCCGVGVERRGSEFVGRRVKRAFHYRTGWNQGVDAGTLGKAQGYASTPSGYGHGGTGNRRLLSGCCCTGENLQIPLEIGTVAERIYSRSESGMLEWLEEEPFSTEEELQVLVADHPEVLDGEQVQPGDRRRWLLITREKGISESPQTGARWAIDHLIVDQDAVPTLVEVKRGTNPDIRRTIVGQMYGVCLPRSEYLDRS